MNLTGDEVTTDEGRKDRYLRKRRFYHAPFELVADFYLSERDAR